MTEIELIRRIARRAKGRAASEGLIRGIGDDCAIVRPRAGEDVLLTTDFVIEGTHFLKSAEAASVGQRALGRGLSDIAAMGGTPRWCLVSLAMPKSTPAKWVDGFYTGLLDMARAHRVALAGGDVARSAKITCDIVVAGTAPKGKALRRDTARAGDRIYVSGELGRPWDLPPEPRLKLGRYLVGRTTAAMDLSDGLSLDLHRLCLESGLAASIFFPLPVWPGVTLDRALHGGEDYELLFTAKASTPLPTQYGGVPLTWIGTMARGRPGAVTFMGRNLAPRGWDHFA
jgi:thiamine-monophosphate kinase